MENNQRIFCNIWEVQITNGCNNNCRYCYTDVVPDTKAIEMPFSTFRKICRRLSEETSGQRLILTGGEPTGHRHFSDFISFAREILPDWILHIQTNARRFANTRLVREIVALGIDSMNISLQSKNAEVHDFLDNVKGAHQEAITGINNLVESYKSFGSPEIAVNITLSKHNAADFLKTVRFLYGLGVPVVTANVMRPRGKNRSMLKHTINDTEAAEMLIKASKLAQDLGKTFTNFHSFNICQFDPEGTPLNHYACSIGKNYIAIDMEGNLLPCLNIRDLDHPHLGNFLSTRPLKDIWLDSELDRFRNHEYTFESCRQCSELERCGGVCVAVRRFVDESDIQPIVISGPNSEREIDYVRERHFRPMV